MNVNKNQIHHQESTRLHVKLTNQLCYFYLIQTLLRGFCLIN